MKNRAFLPLCLSASAHRVHALRWGCRLGGGGGGGRVNSVLGSAGLLRSGLAENAGAAFGFAAWPSPLVN